MSKKFKFIFGALVIGFFIISSFLSFGVNLYTDWLWFESANFSSVFKTIISTKILMRLVIWMIFSLFLLLNLYFTKDKVIELLENAEEKQQEEESTVVELNQQENKYTQFLSPQRLNIIYLLISAVIGFVFSSISLDSWKTILKFFNATPFNMTDPLFNNDLSFYIFKLPLFQLGYQLFSFLIILTAIIVGVIYFITSSGNSALRKISSSHKAKNHFSILAALFFAIKAWGYRLDMFNLLYSDRGVAFGASYTDVHAQILALKVLAVVSLVLSLFIVVNIFIKKFKLIAIGVASLIVISILLGSLYPAFVQQYQVEPNELNRETPYIKHNIKHTQQGYNLDKIVEKDFPVSENLSYEKIKNNEATYNNIRLWDPRPLKSTYSQLQEIRSYYTFNDIDVDRYEIDGELRQVMLGARELDQKSFANQSWVNKRLNYTHGFGVAMSPVSEKTPGGAPKFTIKDIPPQSEKIDITEPRIYYGEQTNEYVIVNTKAQEFDYPEGNKNKYTSYQGEGGVKLSNLLRKISFSIKYGTLKLFLNNDITSESQLMFDRNIKQRVKKVAPFLEYDSDPYVVVADGQLYWIQDAYTTSNMYPYSEPQRWGNYIRNSVKVVTNAYSGQMKFYIVDESDPIAQTYKKIFPNLFLTKDKMPQEIKNHLRYPEELFKIQANMYEKYHMKDPKVFYNKEDMWELPKENYAGQSINVEPYYTLMNLPDDKEKERFLTMLPFTPRNKDNMIAWLGGKSDGELIMYRFPKSKLVYGPRQIESRIDQESSISEQLSLWDQRGSSIIRGNLLTIPIDESILYVEPIYLQSDQSKLPELKRIIVAYGDQVVMDTTLDRALLRIFGVENPEEILEEDEQQQNVPIGTLNNQLLNDLISTYEDAQSELKKGNWESYGNKINELEELIDELRENNQIESKEQSQ
ncbi:UPF0182 family membrane protein [Halanaerobacter jeridensis]|uniref:UPF0182 protein JOC47_001569 n=1 Tax=Halanaerobacter jeridensis TaxID=706427 RepID=A0A939BPE4_9FIRM|nr:UPF0182 family protein [Halanaerobacter jeridensis]MBM7556718.1 uncharacterized membrane protein (UPF0182 family) [Halanaerobacter jeridensis]